jgi:hypothetical protein
VSSAKDGPINNAGMQLNEVDMIDMPPGTENNIAKDFGMCKQATKLR